MSRRDVSCSVDNAGRVTGRLVVDMKSIDTKSKMRDDFFDVGNHPTMVFEVTGARLIAGGQCAIKGTLTIRDATRPVDFQAALRTEADGAVTVEARTEIDRSKWGMTWSMMGAGLHNQVTVQATFVRRDVP